MIEASSAVHATIEAPVVVEPVLSPRSVEFLMRSEEALVLNDVQLSEKRKELKAELNDLTRDILDTYGIEKPIALDSKLVHDTKVHDYYRQTPMVPYLLPDGRQRGLVLVEDVTTYVEPPSHDLGETQPKERVGSTGNHLEIYDLASGLQIGTKSAAFYSRRFVENAEGSKADIDEVQDMIETLEFMNFSLTFSALEQGHDVQQAPTE